ncbi:MAG: ATP-binding protein [Lachnospiraceae bacterium]|nr:ATP-binding protein [Lachnospiraceae bacterium]
MGKYDEALRTRPFKDYNEYMEYIFDCVNTGLDSYITSMKTVYASEDGGYKNVLYPDLEIASDMCKTRIDSFYRDAGAEKQEDEEEDEDILSGGSEDDSEDIEDEDDELLSLLGSFGTSDSDEEEEEKAGTSAHSEDKGIGLTDRLRFIEERAELSEEQGLNLPFHRLCYKMKFEPFTVFCFAAGILSSTQTDYASVYQIINENGNLSSPTIESAAKAFYGNDFSITGAYGDMSTCLEQLLPLLPLSVMNSMPFSTVVSPDKRIIDCLFGRNPDKLDEDYSRFIMMLTDDKELDPILANEGVLDEMKISYDEGVRIFYYYGDEGSGRRFFVKKFCRENGIKAITINCKKLFNYDFRYVETALWAVTRECILTDSCCCLTELTFREEEKEKFFGYMDMAFAKLTEQGVMVFAMSKEHIDFREVTKLGYTELELPTPDTAERQACWEYYSKNYKLAEGIDMLEMATKFLFTPGKISDALKHARSLSVMAKETEISRDKLFKGCYNQMSSELTQKATKVKANFGFEDIVMNPSQRETLEHAIDQMNFRKQVYENWDYTKKYPYGRGLSILLFGAPGTGKSMCAQVIAHELNLELYRVDLSKVIDKYVGETEKSISMIFREAKKCNVVLFFDECDTLFAKRSDDGGSNQSSNNNKTALLLQEVEAYDGVSVLATNYKHNIDPAFFRRMKYIVEFQFPDVDTREMLWRTTIPKGTPLADDVDIRFLAEKFEFVGGNIKNCILNAAFLAAADEEAGGFVHMKHYLLAVKYEFVKVGKVFTRSDFEPYAAEVGL